MTPRTHAVPDGAFAKIMDGLEEIRENPKRIPPWVDQSERIADLEKLTSVMAEAMSTMQQSLIRAHQKLIELDADRITEEGKSGLILPDRMN